MQTQDKGLNFSFEIAMYNKSLSPKFSHAFFRIRNPKNSLEDLAHWVRCVLIRCEKIRKTVAY